MYGETDEIKTLKAWRRTVSIACLIALVALAFVITGLTIRNKPMALIAAALGGCAVYAWSALKAAPWGAYRRFLREMNAGLKHDTSGSFVSISEAPRMVDGISVRDMLVDAGEDADVLFYWDEDKPLPEVKPGDRVTVTSFGRFVTRFQTPPAGQAQGG